MTQAAGQPTDITSGAPSAANAELRCPLCDYDLRGLTEPRCPECGYRFTWEEMRDPSRRLHPYLFEHHPERNAWSFVRTLRGGLRPRRFWTGLTPQTAPNTRRLVLYWLLLLALALPACALSLIATSVATQREYVRIRAIMTTFSVNPANAEKVARREAELGMSIAQDLETKLPLSPSPRFFHHVVGGPFNRTIVFALILAALWPWLTVLGMRLLLRVSLRRARVHGFHVARCAIHAGEIIVWHWLALTIAAGYLAIDVLRGRTAMGGAFLSPDAQRIVLGTLMMLVLIMLASGYRLTVAFQKYLRLPHAWAVVPLTQVIILVALFFLIELLMSVIR